MLENIWFREGDSVNKTKIEWCDFTWNPITGCWGPGGTAEKPNRCWYCYAQKIAERFNTLKITREIDRVFEDPFRPIARPQRMGEPDRINKPSRIFVCSMGELFGDWVQADWIKRVLDVAARNSRHTFLFLTKNPSRYQEFNPWPSNCWLGTTVNEQTDVQARISDMLQADAAIRYISIEPILGPVDLEVPYGQGVGDLVLEPSLGRSHLDWIIIGALTGPGAAKRRPEPAIVQSLINKARASNVPLFLKDNLHWPEVIREWPETPRETICKQSGSTPAW